MSYDVTIGNHWLNHTSNTARMWRAAGCDLAEFHGRTATELEPALIQAITHMALNRAQYEQQDPPNGWGNVETTLRFLQDLLDACREHPDATVDVCR